MGHSNLYKIAHHRQKNGYSISGDDHDFYMFTLRYHDKTAKIGQEHYNSWERTSIVVSLDKGGNLTQTNLIFSSNPPWLETKALQWQEKAMREQ